MVQNEELEFTIRAERKLEQIDEVLHPVRENPYHLGHLRRKDEVSSEEIYAKLCEDLTSVTFGDYLSRFIYKKWFADRPYEDISLAEYILVIRNSFHANGTPYSWEETSEKETARLKRYLTQNRMERKNVFLLGFGLDMNVEDVEELLTKGLKEKGINFKDAFEVICWYCFTNHIGYEKFFTFHRHYLRYLKNKADEQKAEEEGLTIGYKRAFVRAKDEDELFELLEKYNLTEQPKGSKSAFEQFTKLYAEAQEQVVLFFDEGKDPSRVTAGKIEDVLYSAIPKSKKGNRKMEKVPHTPDLITEFSSHMLTRQRIDLLLNRETEVSRTDLITMAFLVHALREENEIDVYSEKTRTTRYSEFIRTVNRVLDFCNFTPILVSNPYECFLLICVLSECPIDMFETIVEEAIAESSI